MGEPEELAEGLAEGHVEGCADGHSEGRADGLATEATRTWHARLDAGKEPEEDDVMADITQDNHKKEFGEV
ncbi:unnamed protein product [Arabidopsis thaliana]|uniref:Uncharacterized protein n=1 Tax=Arabidopsis thaliana TaxID=3702 RepID=A0A5S9WXU2_ARATH|nr:unnamed protein product [Arabidopsis thaliana]